VFADKHQNWLNKPDGGTGWASRFIEQGYEVYIIDQPARGRSAGATNQPPFPAEVVQDRFTAPRFNPNKPAPWSQAALHSQWPGTGVMGDPIFDAFYASQVRFDDNDVAQQEAYRAAGTALLERLAEGKGKDWKGAVLVGHSQGGPMPLILADARPSLVAALVMMEPRGPPFRQAVFSSAPMLPWGLTDIRLTFDPPILSDPCEEFVLREFAAPAEGLLPCLLQSDAEGDPAPRKLVHVMDKPILVVTGEASYHAPYDWAVVRFLRQAGCQRAEHLNLGDVGIHGNGHMFFLEKNSDEIQVAVERWILTQCVGRG
jgi:pimeloyl-ACP methyl ester carboxylesterase